MQCPKCQAELHREQIQDVVIDRCPSCRGILIDKASLAAADGLTLAGSIESRTTLPDVEIDDRPAHCHECDNPMIALQGAGDVQFDWCDRCERIFFDEGELSAFDSFRDDPE